MPQRPGREERQQGEAESSRVARHWRWELAPAASRQLGKLPDSIQQRIFRDLDRLIAGDPSLDNLKLKGGEGYRLRVGSFRVLYDVDKQNRVFIVFRISDRKDAY